MHFLESYDMFAKKEGILRNSRGFTFYGKKNEVIEYAPDS